MKLSAADKKSYYEELLKNVKKVVAAQMGKGCNFEPNEFFNKLVNSFGLLKRTAIKGALLLNEGAEKKTLVLNSLQKRVDIYVEFCQANEPTEDNIDGLASMIVTNTLWDAFGKSPLNFQDGGRRKGKSKKSGSKKSVRRGGKKSMKKTSRRRKTQKSKKALRSRRGSRRV